MKNLFVLLSLSCTVISAQAAPTTNALISNALISNALISNALISNALPRDHQHIGVPVTNPLTALSKQALTTE